MDGNRTCGTVPEGSGTLSFVTAENFKYVTLARDGVSREVPCSALKGETVPDSLLRPPEVPRLPICETAKETQMYRTVFWTLWERARVG